MLINRTSRAFAPRLQSVPLLIFLLALAGQPCRGQQTTATLLGTAVDASGAAVAGVSVTASNLATNARREAVTDQAGNWAAVIAAVARTRMRP